MATHSSVLAWRIPGTGVGWGWGGAWWAAVYGVAQSWTWLKQLSSSSSKVDHLPNLPHFDFLDLMWIESIISKQRLWCWEGLGAGGEGDNRGWDGWMASPTPWTWVWVNSGSWWWTGRPGVLRFMGSQRVGHNWATELNWTELNILSENWMSYLPISLYWRPVSPKWSWCLRTCLDGLPLFDVYSSPSFQARDVATELSSTQQ